MTQPWALGTCKGYFLVFSNVKLIEVLGNIWYFALKMNEKLIDNQNS